MVCVEAYASTHTIFREFLAKSEQIRLLTYRDVTTVPSLFDLFQCTFGDQKRYNNSISNSPISWLKPENRGAGVRSHPCFQKF